MIKGEKEVDTLTINAGATTAGDVTITLNGVQSKISLTEDDNTAVLVATKIAAGTFEGWSVSRSSAKIVFAKNTSGVCQKPSYLPGDTGATGDIAVTKAGTADSYVDA